jgi:hypothetical protein
MSAPRSERSDWTDLDLLTLEEALPRLDEAISAAEKEIGSIADPAENDIAVRRLNGLRHIRERWLARGI